MALTIGGSLFQGIGNYESGSFEHSILVPEMFPTTLEEKANTLQMLVSAGLPLTSAMKKLGFSEDEIIEALQAKVEEQAQSDNALAQSLQRFNEK
jgi:Holliday junction resolvasome RuvABC DNA-binding subunit